MCHVWLGDADIDVIYSDSYHAIIFSSELSAGCVFDYSILLVHDSLTESKKSKAGLAHA